MTKTRAVHAWKISDKQASQVGRGSVGHDLPQVTLLASTLAVIDAAHAQATIKTEP